MNITFAQTIMLFIMASVSLLDFVILLNPEKSLNLVAAIIDLLLMIFTWGTYCSYDEAREGLKEEGIELPENVIDYLLFHRDEDDDKKK